MVKFISIFLIAIIVISCSEKNDIDSKILFILPETSFLSGENFHCRFVIPNSENIKNVEIKSEMKGSISCREGVYFWKSDMPESGCGLRHFKGIVRFDKNGKQNVINFDTSYYVNVGWDFLVSNGEFPGILLKNKKNKIDVVVEGINKKNILLSSENAKLIKEIKKYSDSYNYFLIPISDKDVKLRVSIVRGNKKIVLGEYFYKVCNKNSLKEIVNKRISFLK